VIRLPAVSPPEPRLVDRLIRLAKRVLIVALLLLTALYAADSLRVWLRQAGASGGDVLGAVTFYIAVRLKSGKTEIYYDQPQTEICVRALFPHDGYRPCWYAGRERVRAG
jgi:hypothetical protein